MIVCAGIRPEKRFFDLKVVIITSNGKKIVDIQVCDVLKRASENHD
jgi:hypothetical protein